jgi:hypothetical protein
VALRKIKMKKKYKLQCSGQPRRDKRDKDQPSSSFGLQ